MFGSASAFETDTENASMVSPTPKSKLLRTNKKSIIPYPLLRQKRKNFHRPFSAVEEMLFCSRFHGREQDDVPYACAVGQKHNQSVHAEAQAARRRHAVFQSGDKVFVDLRVNAACGSLCFNLTSEALQLID